MADLQRNIDLPEDDVSEDDFNPEPERGSDDEGDNNADEPVTAPRDRSIPSAQDDEDEDDDAPTTQRRTVADEDGEDDEEELDEEEEEDDEDDDDIAGQPSRKRRRRHQRNQFIDVEAEVDEEDEEEPEEDDDLPGDEMHPDDLQELPPGADRDDRKHRELDRQRELQGQLDAEEEAKRLREKYGRTNRPGAGSAAITDQRLLMPGPDDPRVYRMKCRPGHEREIVEAIQKRAFERSMTREPLKIISAFAREGAMAGNLYFEARTQDDIYAAVDGISHIFMSMKPLMIPVEEMPDLLHTKKDKQLEPGQYVRIKRGLYAGDVAQIEEVEANNTHITLRVVPRLDYGLSEDANQLMDPANGAKRKRPTGQRPPPKLFSEPEARKKHSRFLQRIPGLSNNSWNYQNKDYINGLLVDTFRISAVQSEDVNPTLEEVTAFAAGGADGEENLDLAQLAATLKASSASDFLPGDKVEIFKGEQKGVAGKAVQVYGEVVKVRVESGSLRGQIVEAPIADLRKLFREGDHVKVIGGSKYYDEVGMVVRIKEDRITLLTDSNQQEITVFSKDLREASDSGGTLGNTKYDLFELVQLDVSTVGCVIKVDRESVRVLDQNGDVRSLLPSNIANKIDRRMNAIATDRDGNEIKLEDTVRESGGERKGGRVLHLHRNYVFAQDRERAENSGVFVTRTANVITIAAKGGRVGNGGVDLSKMNPARQNGGQPAPMMPPPQARGRDRLIGRTVRIKSGPSKGLIGLVKDTTDDKAIVEIHGKNKKMQLEKVKLTIIDPNTGKSVMDASGANSMRPPPRTGFGGQTPMRGFADGGRTPSYAMGASARTPSWKQDAGGRTPAIASGGATAYGGYGGSTSYGGQTSYGGTTSYGGGSVWGGSGGYNTGGRTPAGGRTPGYGGLDAPTPGFNSAPTPGNYQDTATPGVFRDQPTPGYKGSYQTPGGFPETPAPFAAETPGANDGPGYD